MPSPNIVIDASDNRIKLDWRELWNYRGLLYFLIWRDIKIRYKQTVLGAGWAILQPVLTMVIFTLIFGNLANIPSDDLPYPIFSYSALLPWIYFSQSVKRSSLSLVNSARLIRKVYFPRLLIPLSATLAPLVDFALSFLVLIGMMIWFGVYPTWSILAIPLLLLLAVLTSLAVSLWLSALNVKYRDVIQTTPFLIQIWLYLTPIIYPVSLVPKQLRLVYGLNPMVGVVEGFRWALLGQDRPDTIIMITSLLIVMIFLMGGLVYFKRTEDAFADVI